MPASVLTCANFAGLVAVNPNPLVLGAVRITVQDHTGAPLPNTRLTPTPGIPGLDCGFQLEAAFRRPVRAICLGVAHYSRPGRVDFFSPAGGNVGSVAIPAPQAVVHTVVATSRAIARVVITAPQDETVLVHFCYA